LDVIQDLKSHRNFKLSCVTLFNTTVMLVRSQLFLDLPTPTSNKPWPWSRMPMNMASAV